MFAKFKEMMTVPEFRTEFKELVLDIVVVVTAYGLLTYLNIN